MQDDHLTAGAWDGSVEIQSTGILMAQNSELKNCRTVFEKQAVSARRENQITLGLGRVQKKCFSGDQRPFII